MKKILGIIILISISTIAFVGCKGNEKSLNESKINVAESTISANSALKIITNKGEKTNDLAVALILNSPDKLQLNQVSNLNKHLIEESEEKILILPMKNGSDIKVEKVKYENDKFITESIVTESKNTPDGYGLYLTVNRPEGIPQYQIVVSNKDISATYIIQYDGKDGTPPSEWMLPPKSD